MRSGYFIDFPSVEKFFQACYYSVLVGTEIRNSCCNGEMPSESQLCDTLSSKMAPENLRASIYLLEEFGCIEKDRITGHFYNITEFGKYMLSEGVL